MRALNVELEKTTVQNDATRLSSPDDSQALLPSDLTDVRISTANAALKLKVPPSYPLHFKLVLGACNLRFHVFALDTSHRRRRAPPAHVPSPPPLPLKHPTIIRNVLIRIQLFHLAPPCFHRTRSSIRRSRSRLHRRLKQRLPRDTHVSMRRVPEFLLRPDEHH
jgi:hypothetical protein